LDPSPVYLAMGYNQQTRQKTYHDMVENLIAGYITKEQLTEFEQIEKATCYVSFRPLSLSKVTLRGNQFA